MGVSAVSVETSGQKISNIVKLLVLKLVGQLLAALGIDGYSDDYYFSRYDSA